ncbi:MAG: PQQ-binding-like beta-propeller repeat protein, partial [Pirellula sp.]
MKSNTFFLSIFTAAYLVANIAFATEDWPQWRFDAQRTAASNNTVPADFSVLWEKRYTPRVQAWDDPLNQDLMTFDKQFEPIAMNGKLLVPFNDECKLVAMDINSGKTLWTFYAEGPIRFAPVGWNDKLFVVSDDGFIYSLSVADGSIQWKFSPAPSTQKVIGNRKVISAWPARGGPTVRDNTVYFASSIWPFMGTFICALDADTGSLKWINDSTGSQYIKQPHSA